MKICKITSGCEQEKRNLPDDLRRWHETNDRLHGVPSLSEVGGIARSDPLAAVGRHLEVWKEDENSARSLWGEIREKSWRSYFKWRPTVCFENWKAGNAPGTINIAMSTAWTERSGAILWIGIFPLSFLFWLGDSCHLPNTPPSQCTAPTTESSAYGDYTVSMRRTYIFIIVHRRRYTCTILLIKLVRPDSGRWLVVVVD